MKNKSQQVPRRVAGFPGEGLHQPSWALVFVGHATRVSFQVSPLSSPLKLSTTLMYLVRSISPSDPNGKAKHGL